LPFRNLNLILCELVAPRLEPTDSSRLAGAPNSRPKEQWVYLVKRLSMRRIMTRRMKAADGA
jgi:hypothetical protein